MFVLKIKKNSFLVVFLFFLPMMVYFSDFLFLSEFISRSAESVFLGFGFACSESQYNFYCNSFGRTVYFVFVLIFPVLVIYWYGMADESKFKFGGSKFTCKILISMYFCIILLLGFGFLPVYMDENPSRKILAIIRLHKNPGFFIFSIYAFSFLGVAIFGASIKYIAAIVRRKCFDDK